MSRNFVLWDAVEQRKAREPASYARSAHLVRKPGASVSLATGDRALGLAPRAYLQLSGGHHQVYTVHKARCSKGSNPNVLSSRWPTPGRHGGQLLTYSANPGGSTRHTRAGPASQPRSV